MQTRWTSKVGFILATAASAIGLGNIWRFPYLVGQYGGGAFIFLYLICVFALGYFMLTSKLAFGRLAHTNIIDGFSKVEPTASAWWGRVCGGLAMLNIFAVSAIYAIVLGWTLSYVFSGFRLVFNCPDIHLDDTLFQNLTQSFPHQLFWAVICIMITGGVLLRGVKKGIEQASLVMMPVLFILLLLLAGWMIFLPENQVGFHYLFQINWTQLGIHADGFHWTEFARLFVNVLGQAIFSLSLGMGVIFTYGSYVKQDTDIKKSALWVVCMDTLVALLAVCIILPAVFRFQLEPTQGPGLSFVTLPFVFSQLAGGTWMMLLFFILLFLAALTSLISVYEPAITVMSEKFKLTRVKSTLLVAGTNILLTTIVLFFTTGQIANLFDLLDHMTGRYTISLMVALCCIFMGWKILPQIKGDLHCHFWFYNYLKIVLRFIAPVVMAVLIIMAII